MLVQSSFMLNIELGMWSFPCCSENQKYIIRDNDNYGKVANIDPLLDELDIILSETALTPYAKVIILVLIILPVPVAIYLMVVNGLIFLIALPIFYIFITWLLVGGCVNGRYASKRINRMGEALETWNSQHGKTQEVEIHLGVRMQLPVVMDIVNYSNFLEASYPSICCRGMGEPCICICKKIDPNAMNNALLQMQVLQEI